VSEDSDGRLGTGRSSNPELIAEDDNVPGYARALMRHFVDLRDNTHGGSTCRQDKEDHFARGRAAAPSGKSSTPRDEQPASARVRADHQYRIAADTRRGPGGFMGSQLAQAALGWSSTSRAERLLRDRFPPSPSEGRDRGGLAAEISSPDPMPPSRFTCCAPSLALSSTILLFRLTTQSFRRSAAGETSRRPLSANETRRAAGRL
jgi:hypothetical protein